MPLDQQPFLLHISPVAVNELGEVHLLGVEFWDPAERTGASELCRMQFFAMQTDDGGNRERLRT